MRILTWNINGIRSLAAVGSWKTVLNTVNADIVCLQETKVTSKFFGSVVSGGSLSREQAILLLVQYN